MLEMESVLLLDMMSVEYTDITYNGQLCVTLTPRTPRVAQDRDIELPYEIVKEPIAIIITIAEEKVPDTITSSTSADELCMESVLLLDTAMDEDVYMT